MPHSNCGWTWVCNYVCVKLWYPLRTRAIPKRFWGGVSRRGAISIARTFTFTRYATTKKQLLAMPHGFSWQISTVDIRKHNLFFRTTNPHFGWIPWPNIFEKMSSHSFMVLLLLLFLFYYLFLLWTIGLHIQNKWLIDWLIDWFVLLRRRRRRRRNLV